MPQSIRIPFESPAAKIEATAKAARSAEVDVRKLEKALVDTAKAGKAVSATQIDALNQARKRAEELRGIVDKNRADAKALTQEHSKVKKYERLASRMSRVFGNSLFMKLANGQNPDVRDFVRLGLSSEKAGLAAGRALGLDVAAVSRLNPLLMILSELVFKKFENDKLQKDIDQNLSGVIMEKFRKGGMGKKAYAEITESGSFVSDMWTQIMGSDPYKKREEKLTKKAEILSQMSIRQIDDYLNDERDLQKKQDTSGRASMGPMDALESWRRRNGKAPEPAISTNDGKRVTGTDIKNAFNAELNKLQREGHGSAPWMEKRAIQDAAADFKISDKQLELLQKQLAVGAEAKQKYESPSQIYRDRHEEIIYRSIINTYEKRVPDNPTD